MKPINLNKTEKALLSELLDMLDGYLGNAGCNDFDLPNTKEGNAIRKSIADGMDEDEDDINIADFMVLEYLRDTWSINKL